MPLDIPFHPLYQLKRLPANDRFMGIFYQVRSKLANVLFPPASQKISSERFLNLYLPDVFLVTQHSVYGGGAPLRFARCRFDAALLQVALDPAYSIALDVELKDFANDLGLLWHYLKNAIPLV